VTAQHEVDWLAELLAELLAAQTKQIEAGN
jgi:hypothetical protein